MIGQTRRSHDRFVLFVPGFKPFYFPERAGAETYAQRYFRRLAVTVEDLQTQARWERARDSDEWRAVREPVEPPEPYWNR